MLLVNYNQDVLCITEIIVSLYFCRTKCIRWSFVAQSVVELIAIAVVSTSVLDACYFQPLSDFGVRKYGLAEISNLILGNHVCSMILCWCFFYFVLHSWQNTFAELLRFAERKFYQVTIIINT